MLYITLVKGHRCGTCTILHYCLTVDLCLDQIWVCTTAVIEKPPVQRDEMACSGFASLLRSDGIQTRSNKFSNIVKDKLI